MAYPSVYLKPDKGTPFRQSLPVYRVAPPPWKVNCL